MFTQTLQRLQQNLNILQEREAKYAGDAPTALLNQIADHAQAIALTEQAHRRELSEAAWREALAPLLVDIQKRSGEAAAINISDLANSVITIQGSVMANIQAGGDVVGGDKIETHNYYQSFPAPEPKSGRCDYYAHINLPPNFVSRPELLAAVKKTLLATEENIALTSAIKMSALHGMSGIGKSVLARALCDDEAVQERFNDGILWTTLGQEVTEDDLKTKLRVWIETLGGVVSATAPTLSQLKNTLAEQLTARACLLVVDDMWRYPDAAWFNAGGPACRLLLTSRDAEAVRQLGADIVPVSTMTEAEAIALLERWAGRPLSQRDPNLVSRIAQRLGYLPLALKLAGEQLRRKKPEQWLAGFSAQKLKSRRDETVHGNLFDTFAIGLSDLPADEQQLYASLVIFKEDEPIPPQAIAMLWSQLGNYDPDDSETLLFDLADRALLQIDAGDQAVTLHDLVRDFMAWHLPEGGHLQAHAALLAGYRATQSGDGWATAPDDGYLYGHLAYHLDAAAAQDDAAAAELKQFFAGDTWLHARVPADDYRYDGYLADLELVWQRAKRAARAQIEAGQSPAAISELVHYALIQTSINSLAGQYSPVLVARAVETGLWSMKRAISVATKVAEPKTQAELCRHLLLVDSLQPAQRRQLSEVGLRAMLAIAHERNQAQVLIGLAPQLSGELLAEALETALAIGSEKRRARVLTGLIPRLSGEAKAQALTEALKTALTIDREWSQAKVLAGLAPHLSGGELLAEALEAALAIGDERYRAEALIGLAPQLSGKLLIEALEGVLVIDNEWYQAKVLTGLAPQLSGKLLVEALEAALLIGDKESQ